MRKIKPPVYDRQTGLPYTPNDLSMRLNRSLIRYKGKPFYVVDVNGTVLEGVYTYTGDPVAVPLPDKKLDVRPVPLGYVNLEGRMHYCSRVPHRKYKQGLCAEALHVSTAAFDKRALVSGRHLAACVMNKYPSFDEALHTVQRTGGSCAFSRRFGLSKDKSGVVFIEYRGDRVGWYSGRVELGEKHFYLKEELEVIYEGA